MHFLLLTRPASTAKRMLEMMKEVKNQREELEAVCTRKELGKDREKIASQMQK
jgi:hypothetical protein